jgi:hypothetical protein
VLPRIYWNAQRALFDKAATRLRDGANKASKPMPPIANIAESSCAAGIFVIAQCTIDTHSMSSRPIDGGRKRFARTLSRGFWQ